MNKIDMLSALQDADVAADAEQERRCWENPDVSLLGSNRRPAPAFQSSN